MELPFERRWSEGWSPVMSGPTLATERVSVAGQDRSVFATVRSFAGRAPLRQSERTA